jgi:hypothetical protein
LHSCAIQAGTGNVVCWPARSQMTPPDDVNGVSGTATAIAAGNVHDCAIQAGTGNVVCWGYDVDGQATPPDDVNGVSGTATDIAAGDRHSCAIQAGTGNVVCWGYDVEGQATPPASVDGTSGTASAIAAGLYHSLAIKLAIQPPTIGDFDGDEIEDTLDNCSVSANRAQDDTDGDDCGNLCDADYDNDGTVGFGDFGIFMQCYNSNSELCDHTEPVGGGPAGFADFGFFVGAFGNTPGPSGTTAGTTACP